MTLSSNQAVENLPAAEIVFAPDTLGRVIAGTPMVVCTDHLWEIAINDYLHELALDVSAGRLSPSSLETYGYAAGPVARAGAALGVAPSRLGPEDVRNIIHDACRREAGRLSAASEVKIRTFIGGLLRFHAAQDCPKSRYIEKLLFSPRGQPLPGLLPLKRRFKPLPTPTDDDIRALRTAARTDTEASLLALLHGLGARRAEARIVPIEQVLKLEKTLNQGDDCPLLLPLTGKRNKTREVPVERSLAIWLVALAKKRVAAGAPLSGPIVANRFGAPISSSGVNDVLHRLSNRAGIPAVTPHGLRRKFSDDWAEAHGQGGALTLGQLRVLAALLGHSGIGTLKHYLTHRRENRHAA